MAVSTNSSTGSFTPILDSGVLPPASRSKEPSRIKSILALIGGLIVILPVVAWTDKNKRPGTAFLLVVAAIALTVVVHELGHLFAGWVVGLQFHAIHIGPFSLSSEHGKLRMRARREMLAAGPTGMYARTVRRLRRRLLLATAGGPVANVVSVPVAVILINRMFPQLAETSWGAFASQFTVFSLIAAIANLAPIRSDILQSDGAVIETLLCSRERRRRWMSLYAVGKQYKDGVRPRNWRCTWVKAAVSVGDASYETFSGNWLAYMAASDRKDDQVAAIHLEKCLRLTPKMPVSITDVVAQEAAVFSGWSRRDASLADKWYSQMKKPRQLEELFRLRLEVAMACAHQHFDDANRTWRKGLTFIESMKARPARSNLRDSWLEWQTEIRERQSTFQPESERT